MFNVVNWRRSKVKPKQEKNLSDINHNVHFKLNYPDIKQFRIEKNRNCVLSWYFNLKCTVWFISDIFFSCLGLTLERLELTILNIDYLLRNRVSRKLASGKVISFL